MAVIKGFDSSEHLCYEILEAVAECHNIEPTDIEEPLGETVDPDSITSLWGPKATETDTVNGALMFEYYDCRITITSDGRIEAKKLSG